MTRKAFAFDEHGNVRTDLSDEAVLAVVARCKLKRDCDGYYFARVMIEEALAWDVERGRLPASVLNYTPM